MEFDWDDVNVAHIARHGIAPEEAVTDRERTRFAAYRSPTGRPRRGYVGKTEAGRVLVVNLEQGAPSSYRVITARCESGREADVPEVISEPTYRD